MEKNLAKNSARGEKMTNMRYAFILIVGGFNGFYGNGLIVGGFNGFCGKILIVVIS